MDGKTSFIVMEFMNQGSLQDLLQRGSNNRTPAQLAKMVFQTLQGMVYLESKNVIHCDLAARNLLVNDSKDGYNVKVGDLGMGKATSTSVYYSKDSKFPVKWAAPEVIQYLKYSSKSDVWAFGKIFSQN